MQMSFRHKKKVNLPMTKVSWQFHVFSLVIVIRSVILKLKSDSIKNMFCFLLNLEKKMPATSRPTNFSLHYSVLFVDCCGVQITFHIIPSTVANETIGGKYVSVGAILSFFKYLNYLHIYVHRCQRHYIVNF